jgi:hypothetical protein
MGSAQASMHCSPTAPGKSRHRDHHSGAGALVAVLVAVSIIDWRALKKAIAKDRLTQYI